MSRKRAVQRNARRGMRRIEGAAGSPAPRDPLHEGLDPFFSSLLGLGERREQPRRAVTLVTELPLQRHGAIGRDGPPPDARDGVDRPGEGLDGPPEAPDHERATGRAGGGSEETTDPLPPAADRGGKLLTRARRGDAPPARARDAGEARSRRRHATSTGYAAVDGARIAIVAYRGSHDLAQRHRLQRGRGRRMRRRARGGGRGDRKSVVWGKGG